MSKSSQDSSSPYVLAVLFVVFIGIVDNWDSVKNIINEINLLMK